MTLVVPEGFASVIHSMRWTGDPEPMAVTYGVAIDPGSPPASATVIASTCASAFTANLLDLLIDDIELINTEVSWQETAPPDPPTIGNSTVGGSGIRVGTTIPQNSAFLVHKRTGLGGRGGRGRMYFPGVQEAVVSDLGQLTGSEITDWNTALGDFLAALVADPDLLGMVLLHNDPGAFSAEPPYLVTSLNLDPTIATQRRRLRR